MESINFQDARYYAPDKKYILQSDNTFDVVLMDVSESPVIRP